MIFFSRFLITIALVAFFVSPHPTHAQERWRVDSRGQSGALVQVGLPNSFDKRRAVFVAFEYARRCDPVFSFVEIKGQSLGRPLTQKILRETQTGVLVNGKFHTWHAAMTSYENGYESGFGITNDLFDLLTGNPETLVYVIPDGEKLSLPTVGFRQGLLEALQICSARVR